MTPDPHEVQTETIRYLLAVNAEKGEEIRRLTAELAAAQAELTAAMRGPVVEWRYLPGSAGWERADVGRFSLLLMGDSGWRLLFGDQAVADRGSPGGPAGKAAAEAAYRKAAGLA